MDLIATCSSGEEVPRDHVCGDGITRRFFMLDIYMFIDSQRPRVFTIFLYWLNTKRKNNSTLIIVMRRGSSGIVASSRHTAHLLLSTRVRGTLLAVRSAVRPAVRLAAQMTGGFRHCCGDTRHASLPGPAGTLPSEVGLSPYAVSWAGGGDVVTRSLPAGTQTVHLVQHGVNDGVVATVEGVDGVLTPEGISGCIRSRNTQSWVNNLEPQVVCEHEIFEVTAGLHEAFAEIFVFEKRLPAITDTGSCRLSV